MTPLSPRVLKQPISLLVLGWALLITAALAEEPPPTPPTWLSNAEKDLAQVREERRTQERDWMFTFFRSPATGLEYKRDVIAYHVGFYPDWLKRPDETKASHTMFLRFGIKALFNGSGSSFFLTGSWMSNLDGRWSNGIMLEGGYRWKFLPVADIRFGIGGLFTGQFIPQWEPTIGLGILL